MKNKFFFLILSVLFLTVTCKQNKSEPVVETTQSDSEELQSVLINGDSIHYIDVGKGEPVVFVHGGLGNYESWAFQVDTFATKHRVIAYSRRYAYPNNQNYSDSVDYSVVPHAKDLATLIKILNLGPVHLVGHSWGAFTALKATIDHPELVQSLTLGEPPVHSLIENTKIGDSLLANLELNTFEPSAQAFKQGDNENGIALFIGGVMGDSLMYEKTSEYWRNRMQQNVLGLRGLMINHNRDFLDIKPKTVQTIKTPVLVIKGDISPLFLREIAIKLDSLLPNSQLFTLPNSSHGLQSSNPKVFNETVLEFIESN